MWNWLLDGVSKIVNIISYWFWPNCAVLETRQLVASQIHHGRCTSQHRAHTLKVRWEHRGSCFKKYFLKKSRFYAQKMRCYVLFYWSFAQLNCTKHPYQRLTNKLMSIIHTFVNVLFCSLKLFSFQQHRIFSIILIICCLLWNMSGSSHIFVYLVFGR